MRAPQIENHRRVKTIKIMSKPHHQVWGRQSGRCRWKMPARWRGEPGGCIRSFHSNSSTWMFQTRECDCLRRFLCETIVFSRYTATMWCKVMCQACIQYIAAMHHHVFTIYNRKGETAPLSMPSRILSASCVEVWFLKMLILWAEKSTSEIWNLNETSELPGVNVKVIEEKWAFKKLDLF